MNALRILILCISAALICASLRMMHPQIATAVGLAAGIAALMLSVDDMRGLSDTVKRLESYTYQENGTQLQLLKICGIAMIAEFASDICRDAGENALAHRIDVGIKIGIVVLALPAAAEIMEKIAGLLA